jgi:O-antigen ligase
MYDAMCTTDRSFNEYIDVAMQRGILCLVLYVVFLLITLKKMGSAVAAHFKDSQTVCWVSVGLLCAFAGYLVQAFFNSGSNYSSPYFFIIAGIGWSYMAAGKIAAAAPEKKGKTTGSKK